MDPIIKGMYRIVFSRQKLAYFGLNKNKFLVVFPTNNLPEYKTFEQYLMEQAKCKKNVES